MASGYDSALSKVQTVIPWWDAHAETMTRGRLDDLGRQFSSLFQNYVGRAPTSDELDSFYSNSAGNIVVNSPETRIEAAPEAVRNQLLNYVGDTYQGAAQDYASQQLQGQQAQANSLAELFRTQGRQAISQTENQLLDYQQRLFERLRPNLMTSLQAQGLLNTGGLNEALAGAQGDLANAAQGQLIDMNFQNEQGANAIAYGGASAPYMFEQQNILNRPQQLQAGANNAMNMAFHTYMQNLQHQQQSALMRQQASLSKPSFLQTLGQGFASGLGQNLSKLPFAANPQSFIGQKLSFLG